MLKTMAEYTGLAVVRFGNGFDVVHCKSNTVIGQVRRIRQVEGHTQYGFCAKSGAIESDSLGEYLHVIDWICDNCKKLSRKYGCKAWRKASQSIKAVAGSVLKNGFCSGSGKRYQPDKIPELNEEGKVYCPECGKAVKLRKDLHGIDLMVNSHKPIGGRA